MLQKPNLAEVVRGEGVNLRERANKHIGLCPFHSEKTPSFYVYPDGYHCYGCGAHGRDSIDYVRNAYGYSFKEALQHLGIEAGKPSRVDRAKLDRKKIDRATYKQRESDLSYSLGTLIRWTRKAMAALTPEDFDEYGQIVDQLPYWEYAHDTLIHGTPEEKREVVEAFKDFDTIERNPLWETDFDYRTWLDKQYHRKPKE